MSVAAIAVVLMALSILGWRSARMVRGGDGGLLSAQTRNGLRVMGAHLPELYRADTASARRYLAAEADLGQLRLKAARQSFQQLVDSSPLYAPAWAGLSFTLFQSGFTDIPPADALPRAVAAANRALALDSSLVEARGTLIANAMFGRWDLDDAKRQLDVALARNPDDPELNNLLATWHRWRGEHEAAIRLKRAALKIDPLSSRYANQVGSGLYFAHRCGEAAEVFRRVAEERRRPSNVRLLLYRSLKCQGKMDDAATALRESLIETGDTALARLLDPPLTSAQRRAAIDAVFRARLDGHFAERTRRWRTSTQAMVQYAELGNRDSTLVWLDSMYVERAFMLHVVPFDPMMDFIRADPRFDKFLRRLPWLPDKRQPVQGEFK